MLTRVFVIALNTYREAVRARILHGLFALAVATGCYSLVVGGYAVRQHLRVVSDLGSASISLYGVVVAIVLGASSLYRELELKTLFPILARPLRRSEYLVGKYLGTWLTLAAFVVTNAGALLVALGVMAGASLFVGLGSLLVLSVGSGLVAWRRPRSRTYLPIPVAMVLFVWGWFFAGGAVDDRQVVASSMCLTLLEVGIVTALATLFASFTSPFLTAVFTLGIFVVGRSAEALAQLPASVFGSTIHNAGELLAKVVPNLLHYVPERPVLTGEAATPTLTEHLLWAGAQAAGWIVFLLLAASVIFRRRDFL